MSMNRHEPFEELISASLRGDLTADERERLDRHLDSCAECRSTLAAFADQRRIVAGLRHLAPPRDLSARVRAGIEGGRRLGLPWWRRPPVLVAGVGGGLAAVAGALLALVLLNGDPDSKPPVGQATPTSSAVIAPSTTPIPTLPPPPPSAQPSAAPSEPVASTPSAAPTSTASPEPEVFLAVTGPVESPEMVVVDGTTGSEVAAPSAPPGEPIAAELSPDGQWLAYVATVGASGMNEVYATRVAVAEPSDDPEAMPPIESETAIGDTISLGRSVGGSPFLEHLFWSADSRYLAYTLADPEGDGTDVWIFQPGTGETARRTDAGNAYAGSWAFSDAGTSALWVSTAGETPLSYLMVWHDDAGPITPADPADSEFSPATNVFQPLVSPNGAFVIFWAGRMEQTADEWLFSEGGQPWLAQHADDGDGGFEFVNARELFRDLTVGRDAFSSAAITWGSDGDTMAVWDAEWTGLPQTDEGDYPDRERVYFGHATDPRGLTRFHAIDEDDIPDGAFVVDVKVSPTGRHLLVTAARGRAGALDPPRADLLLIERNTGSVADVVETLGSADDGWFGPAAFDRTP